jgi:predicted permease
MSTFSRLMRRRDPGRHIDNELQFHIDEQADAYVQAGMTRDEALRRARIELGGVQQIKEDVRDVWAWRWFDDLARDVQFALRTHARAPIAALTAVLTLALGIGVNTALFTIVREVLLKSLPVSNPHELVQIDCNSGPQATGGAGACMHSYPAFRLLSERHDGLSGVVAFSPVPNGLIASFRGRRELVTGQLASANVFDVLGLRPAAGRLLQETDDRPGAEPVAVLSYGYWLRGFGGSSEVIGQALTLNNRSVTIAGVLPRTFRGITFGEAYDIVVPLGTADAFRSGPPTTAGARESILNSRNMGWLTFVGRRQSGVSPDEIATRLQPVFRQSAEEMLGPVPLEWRKRLNLSADGIRVDVRPAMLGATSSLRRTLEPTLQVLVVVAVLILLIACANLAGLFLAQATSRQREFGLRLALGAGRSRLLRQVFTESLLLAGIGGALGLLLAQWIGPAAFTLATDDTGLRAVDLGPDRRMLAFTAALSVLAGLIVGAASVLRASAANPQEALRSRRTQGSPRLTKALLTAQIALTVTLVGSAALLLQTLTNFRRIDVGFEPRQLLAVTMDAGLGTFERSRAAEYVRQAASALAAVPGVQAVTYSNRAFGTGVPINLAVNAPSVARSSAEHTSTGVISAGPGFVRTLGLTLLAGRDFEPTDREDSAPVAIVNESFAMNFFGHVNVVGQTFAFRGPGNQPILITGVVKDARDSGLKRETQPVIYQPFGQRELNTVTFTMRAATAVSSLSDTVRRTLEQLNPAVGIARMRTVEAQFDDVLRRERLLAALGAVFGSLALVLLAIGLYGMLNAMVVRRTPEIGLRMALGAGRHRIVSMLAFETFVVVVAGVGFGVAGYVAAGRAIQTELFGVTRYDPTAAGAAVAALVVIAAIAVWLPARRATRIDPTEALRHDCV